MEENRLKNSEISNVSMKSSSPSISPGASQAAATEEVPSASYPAPLDKDENNKPSAEVVPESVVETAEWPKKIPKLRLSRVNSEWLSPSQPQTPVRRNPYRKKRNIKTPVGQGRSKEKLKLNQPAKEHVDERKSDSKSDDPSFKVRSNKKWTAFDDLRLKVNVEQTCDLEQIHIGVKFSCNFALEEITERWRSLLCDETASRTAQKAIMHLHPAFKKRILKDVLFSDKEEELLMAVNEVPVGNPDLDVFQELLKENVDIFYGTRTPECLFSHWQRLKLVNFLHCQKERQPKDRFEEFEMDVNDDELKNKPVDEVRAQELEMASRSNMRSIKKLEKETKILTAVLDNLVIEERPGPVQTDRIATLRGERIEYAMRSQELTFGRRTPFNFVDADIQLEGSANHVSRRQGKITIDKNGYFHIFNFGRNNVIVNSKPLRPSTETLIEDQSVILIGPLSFVFEVNKLFVQYMRQAYCDKRMQSSSTTKKNSQRGIPKDRRQSQGGISKGVQSESGIPNDNHDQNGNSEVWKKVGLSKDIKNQPEIKGVQSDSAISKTILNQAGLSTVQTNFRNQVIYTDIQSCCPLLKERLLN